MASPGLTEAVTVSIRNRSKSLADNVTSNNALLLRLSSKGNVEPFDGGRTIVQELEYAENSTFKRYSGYEQLDISPSDVFTAAEYNIKQAAVAVSISGLEEIQNSGRSAMINLIRSRVKNAERTMKNNISADVYSDGTANGSKQITGLQAQIADSPSTGTVGGINRATYSFWRNVSFDATTDGGAAATSSNIKSYMNQVYVQICRGTDKPDLIVADNNYWRLYLESLQDIQRIADDKMAQAGFQSLKYMTADVVLDGGYGGDAPTNHMYFINTDYLHYRPYSGRNMVPLNPDRHAVNQDAVVKLIGWAGNLTMSNAFLQGVLKD